MNFVKILFVFVMIFFATLTFTVSAWAQTANSQNPQVLVNSIEYMKLMKEARESEYPLSIILYLEKRIESGKISYSDINSSAEEFMNLKTKNCPITIKAIDKELSDNLAANNPEGLLWLIFDLEDILSACGHETYQSAGISEHRIDVQETLACGNLYNETRAKYEKTPNEITKKQFDRVAHWCDFSFRNTKK